MKAPLCDPVKSFKVLSRLDATVASMIDCYVRLQAFLISLGLGGDLLGASPQVQGGNSHNLCTSEHCVGASHRLFTNMNLSADPCVDFEQFTCGRFQQDRCFRISWLLQSKLFIFHLISSYIDLKVNCKLI